VPQAAARLGMTEAAVRGRIKRRTLRSYREAGAVYVVLEGDEPPTNHDEPGGEPADQSELVAVLREQLALEREANRENRRIIAALTSRIPQLEAPQEARESPVSPGPSDTPNPAPEEAQDAAEPPRDRTHRLQQELLETRQRLEEERSRPRSWWRRVFGG
jgi:hypothetical protein